MWKQCLVTNTFKQSVDLQYVFVLENLSVTIFGALLFVLHTVMKTAPSAFPSQTRGRSLSSLAADNFLKWCLYSLNRNNKLATSKWFQWLNCLRIWLCNHRTTLLLHILREYTKCKYLASRSKRWAFWTSRLWLSGKRCADVYECYSLAFNALCHEIL